MFLCTGTGTVVLVFTQVWGYAKVWVLGRFWLRLGPRFGGAADPGFTPRSRGFVANPENPPPWVFYFSFSPIRAGAVQRERAPDLVVPRLLRSQGARGNLDLLQGVAGEAAHLEEAEEGTLPPGGGPDGRRGLAHRSQVLRDVPRPGRSAQSGFSSRVSGLGNQRPE